MQLGFLIFAAIIIGNSAEVESCEHLSEFNSFYNRSEYKGEKFPDKYLVPEDWKPSLTDLKHYLGSIRLVVDNLHTYKLNDTDLNIILGMFFTKAILKRTLIDYKDKFEITVIKNIKNLIRKAEDIVSHYTYNKLKYGWEDYRFRFSQLFKYDEAQVYSIKPFNRHILKKWLLHDINMNEFIEVMDEATLPKEEFVNIIVDVERYMSIADSDECMSRISFNREPINMTLSACYQDTYCQANVLWAGPSVTYALSHRLLNTMGLFQMRRCFMISEQVDNANMDIMCANMYREAVYIARRGYFARDLFLEHIALCGLLGYEELFRRHWFYKAMSWIDEDGCMHEDRNFERNYTMLLIDKAKDPTSKRSIRHRKKYAHNKQCNIHAMILLSITLAHGVRHGAHFMTDHD